MTLINPASQLILGCSRYNTPKYRLVARFTNKDVICQFMYSTIAGDVVVAAARSRELHQFGLKVGLSNYAAAYCTGLLAARRVLTHFGLADTYTGVEEATGEPKPGGCTCPCLIASLPEAVPAAKWQLFSL